MQALLSILTAMKRSDVAICSHLDLYKVGVTEEVEVHSTR